MKKLTALLLAMLVAACLFACGQSEKAELYPDFTTCEPETITETTEEATVAEVTTTYYEDNYVADTGTFSYYEDAYTEYIGETETTYSYGDALSYEDFYYTYYSMSNATWDDCVYAAYSQWGMDEYQLMVALGWTVNEQYTWYDLYLAYLCANCPWSFIGDAWSMADGLAGWDYSGMYSVDNLVWQSYYASQEELNILYLAITHPYYGIFECNGISWYGDDQLIYYSWCNGWQINVWVY